ncbi:MAG TPA: hypothetical protein VNS02_01790 [Rhizobiaceae bacterium]|nr:hypothetical protein [Rhizobiaceae bacterium]
MSVAINPFLRNVLAVDAAMSLAAGAVSVLGAGLLAPLLGLPQPLLFWAGLFLLPWSAFLFALSRRAELSRLLLIDVIAINGLWVVASVAILVAGLVTPNVLGIAFLLVQAAAVAVLAELQFMGLRRGRLAAA